MAENEYQDPTTVAAASTSRAAEPTKATGKPKVSAIVTQSDNGGFIVTCIKGDQESKDYTFGSYAEASTFMAKEFGQAPSAAEPKPQAGPPAPAQAPRPPMARPSNLPPAQGRPASGGY